MLFFNRAYIGFFYGPLIVCICRRWHLVWCYEDGFLCVQCGPFCLEYGN